MKSLAAPGEREENETEKGLRVADKGFLNTAAMRSEITYVDGDAGGELLSNSHLRISLLRSSSLQVPMLVYHFYDGIQIHMI
jgi:citrate synthase